MIEEGSSGGGEVRSTGKLASAKPNGGCRALLLLLFSQGRRFESGDEVALTRLLF